MNAAHAMKALAGQAEFNAAISEDQATQSFNPAKETPSKQVLDNRRRVREWCEKHPDYINGPRNRFARSKSKAKFREIEWRLTFEQWSSLVIGAECHYCHQSINPTGSGLDRKDSDLGYTFDNVVPCCGDCNKIKNDILTYEEMVFLMPLLMDFRKGE